MWCLLTGYDLEYIFSSVEEAHNQIEMHKLKPTVTIIAFAPALRLPPWIQTSLPWRYLNNLTLTICMSHKRNCWSYLCVTISAGPGVCVETWIPKALFKWYLFELVNRGPSELWITWRSFSSSLWINLSWSFVWKFIDLKKQFSTTLHFPTTGCTWNVWYMGYTSSKLYNQLSSPKCSSEHSLLTLEMFKSLIK